MEMLNEIIEELSHCKEVIEDERIPGEPDFTLEGTDSGFDENDPQQLCEECKAIGFCRTMHPEKFALELQRLKITEDDISEGCYRK